MGLKIFKAMWFVSMVAVLANLLYNYAGLPETLSLADSAAPVSREQFFYVMMGVICLVNFMVYPISRLFKSNLDLRAWFHGLVITLNIFFVITMNFIGLINSGERFDYSRISVIIYGSVGLIVVWALGWPVYSLYKKMFIKQSVDNA